jgi:hypothetical protein
MVGAARSLVLNPTAAPPPAPRAASPGSQPPRPRRRSSPSPHGRAAAGLPHQRRHLPRRPLPHQGESTLCLSHLPCSVTIILGSLTYLQIFSASRLDIPSAWQMPQVIQSPLRDTRGNNPTHTLQTDWLTTGWYRPGGRSESSCI